MPLSALCSWEAIQGEYASAPLLLSAVTLIAALLLVGHLVANLCFPALRRRFRVALTRRVDAAVDAAWQQAQEVLRDHVEAVDCLARQGHAALHTMDHIVQALAWPAQDNCEVQRLFGDAVASPAATPLPAAALVPVPEGRRGPHFE